VAEVTTFLRQLCSTADPTLVATLAPLVAGDRGAADALLRTHPNSDDYGAHLATVLAAASTETRFQWVCVHSRPEDPYQDWVGDDIAAAPWDVVSYLEDAACDGAPVAAHIWDLAFSDTSGVATTATAERLLAGPRLDPYATKVIATWVVAHPDDSTRFTSDILAAIVSGGHAAALSDRLFADAASNVAYWNDPDSKISLLREATARTIAGRALHKLEYGYLDTTAHIARHLGQSIEERNAATHCWALLGAAGYDTTRNPVTSQVIDAVRDARAQDPGRRRRALDAITVDVFTPSPDIAHDPATVGAVAVELVANPRAGSDEIDETLIAAAGWFDADTTVANHAVAALDDAASRHQLRFSADCLSADPDLHRLHGHVDDPARYAELALDMGDANVISDLVAHGAVPDHRLGDVPVAALSELDATAVAPIADTLRDRLGERTHTWALFLELADSHPGTVTELCDVIALTDTAHVDEAAGDEH
jgi:hypothetical protein